MEFSKLRIRGKAMREGAWFPFEGDFEVKLRATQAEEVKEAFEVAIDRKRKALGIRQGRELPNREIEEAMRSQVYGKVLLDWRNLNDGGEPVPCTEENFKKACDADPSFLNRLISMAADQYEYGYSDAEEVERD